MKYVVFEAGSRAGLSAMLFFLHYKKVTGADDTLLMVDADQFFVSSFEHRYDCVETMTEECFLDMCSKEDEMLSNCKVFPADELSRQKGMPFALDWWNVVTPLYYDKQFVNEKLAGSGVSVPKTFDVSGHIIVKPNRLSAGSKGIQCFDHVCVSQMIDIAHEYVVDCFVSKQMGKIEARARETRLKNGYDKYVRLLPPLNKVSEFVMDAIDKAPFAISGMFTGVCHMQVAEDHQGKLFYIEGSKRISGTSLVLLPDGYNPFLNINGVDRFNAPGLPHDKWFSYEQLLIESWRCING